MKYNVRKTFLFVWLVLLLGVVTIAAMPHASFADAEPQLLLESTTIDRWQLYEDSDYAFALEYPVDWEVMTLIEQQQPYPEPEKIVRKYAFTGPEGYITLSIFLTQGLDLSTWLKQQNEISSTLFPVMEANAWVAGYPAVAFVTDDNLIVFMSNDKYVYRLWHPVTENTLALQANWHMLDTFRTTEGDSVDANTQIPQSVKDKAQDALEAAKNHTNQNNNCTSIQGQGCCELPHLQACYRFPCSRLNEQDMGNCTYYVCYRYGGVPFSGSAGTWWGQVPTTPGWYSYSTPPNGTSIAWWGNPGHVGYISSYWGGGRPTVYEQNWCDTCTRARVTWAQGYIQKGTQPMAYPLHSKTLPPQ